MESKTRNSSLEVLRIIATFMVLISHYSFHGCYVDGQGYTYITNIFNRLLLQTANVGSLGVDIFVIITGYCMLNSTFRVHKLISLLAQVWFYSILVLVFIASIGLEPLATGEVLKSLFPATFGRYWFFTTYIVLYLLSPNLNRLLIASSKKQNLTMLSVMFILWSVFPTITTGDWGVGNVPLFLLLYTIGACLRMYASPILQKHGGIFVLFGTVCWVGCAIILNVLGIWFPIFSIHVTYIYGNTSVLTIVFATIIVSYASGKHFISQRINRMASGVFATYLLTDNGLIRSFLWKTSINCMAYIESPFLIFHIAISVVSLFVFALLIETIRKNTVGEIVDYYIKRTQNRISKNLI